MLNTFTRNNVRANVLQIYYYRTTLVLINWLYCKSSETFSFVQLNSCENSTNCLIPSLSLSLSLSLSVLSPLSSLSLSVLSLSLLSIVSRVLSLSLSLSPLSLSHPLRLFLPFPPKVWVWSKQKSWVVCVLTGQISTRRVNLCAYIHSQWLEIWAITRGDGWRAGKPHWNDKSCFGII